MKLYIVRHAIAELLGESNAWTDSDRALTKEGKDKMQSIARGLRAMEATPERILTSPYKRAKETGDILVEAFEAGIPLEILPELAAGTSSRKLIEALKRFEGSCGSITIVGHEPDLSGLISTLVAGSSGLAITMKKGGFCSLTVSSLRHGRCAVLDCLLTPKQLVRIRAHRS